MEVNIPTKKGTPNSIEDQAWDQKEVREQSSGSRKSRASSTRSFFHPFGTPNRIEPQLSGSRTSITSSISLTSKTNGRRKGQGKTQLADIPSMDVGSVVDQGLVSYSKVTAVTSNDYNYL